MWAVGPHCLDQQEGLKQDTTEEKKYMYGKVSLTSIERELLNRVEELERKVSLLGGDPKQLEMDV